MPRPAAQPSKRLLAAATAERAGIERQRQRLLKQRQTLHDKIDRLDAELTELDERARMIDRLAPVETGAPAAHETDPTSGAEDSKVVRGPQIRQAAVKVLLADPRRPQALHYRDWHALLEQNGYVVAGKDPLAVFLTQLNRSPVVRRGTQSGVYELNTGAVAQLHRRLEERQRELRKLIAAPSSAADLSAIRSQRTSLNQEIGKLESALQEAEQTLAGHPVHLAAAS